LTNNGIRMIRMTMTKPTIDSAHVIPESSGRPMNEKAVWKLTISHATTHSSGASTVSNIEFIESFVVGWPGRSAGFGINPYALRSRSGSSLADAILGHTFCISA